MDVELRCSEAFSVFVVLRSLQGVDIRCFTTLGPLAGKVLVDTHCVLPFGSFHGPYLSQFATKP